MGQITLIEYDGTATVLDIEAGTFVPNKDIHHTHEGSIGNLCNDRIEALMNETSSQFHFDRMEEAEKELLR